jgi:hypothetical protein
MTKLMFRIPNISVSMCGEGQKYSEITYKELRFSCRPLQKRRLRRSSKKANGRYNKNSGKWASSKKTNAETPDICFLA